LICERLLAETALRNARQVGLFWPIERFKEVDLRGVDAELRRRQTEIAYPAIDASSRRMTFHLVDDVNVMAPSELGFLAPPLTAPMAEALDVVLVPGIAFDGRGHRIGYGGGFYDGAIAGPQRTGMTIGVAFDFQLAPELPNSEHDAAVDVIVTDERTLRVIEASAH
jgi:5-formyltetrahydrofolate cyclo-ligase